MAEEAIEFREMADGEFERFIQLSAERYAQEIADNTKRSIDEVRVEVKRQGERLLKDGSKTKGHFFFNVEVKGTGERVGAVWFHVDEKNKSAFLMDISVNEQQRGKGYGKKTLNLLEKTLKEMNLEYLRLHVAANNEVAINLYRTQGLYTTGFDMQKVLRKTPDRAYGGFAVENAK